MIYIKSKYNPIIKQQIPHNTNFASAMYGFIEMGAEIQLFNNWSEIQDKINKDDILVDYTDSVEEFVSRFGGKFNLTAYPPQYNDFYRRMIWKDTINNFASNINNLKESYFIKSVKKKKFMGKVVKSNADLVTNENENYEIYVSHPLNIVKEWRVFILYDEIVGIKCYKGEMFLSNDNFIKDFTSKIIKIFKNTYNRPNACSIDIGLVGNFENISISPSDLYYPIIVEFNDCISLECYGLDSIKYAKMISARQSQVMHTIDLYKF